MYCPSHFEEDRPEVLHHLIAQYPFATIISANQLGLCADHIPLIYTPVATTLGTLNGHVAKNNPLWQADSSQELLVIFQGPSTYITPNWYASKSESGKVVPTWNYAVVHVHATLTAHHEPATILSLLTQLTQQHEANQANPWRVTDAPPEFTQQRLAGIVGIELHIKKIQGKWKVSQNQPHKNRSSLINGLHAQKSDATTQMALLVQKYGEDIKK